MEAVEAGVPPVICITEGIPAQDMINKVRAFMQGPRTLDRSQLPWGNLAGSMQIGIMPAHIHKQGPNAKVRHVRHIDVRSGRQLSKLGIGQSIRIGSRGDPIIDPFYRRNPDVQCRPDTHAIIMIGEIGGNAEAIIAARYIQELYDEARGRFYRGTNCSSWRRWGTRAQ